MNIKIQEVERPFQPMELILQMYDAEDFKMLRRVIESAKTPYSKSEPEYQLAQEILDRLKLKLKI